MTQFSRSRVKADGPRDTETRGIEAAEQSRAQRRPRRPARDSSARRVASRRCPSLKIGQDSNQPSWASGRESYFQGKRKKERSGERSPKGIGLVPSAVWPVLPSLSPRWPPDSPTSFASGKNSLDDGLKCFRFSRASSAVCSLLQPTKTKIPEYVFSLKIVCSVILLGFSKGYEAEILCSTCLQNP